MPVIRIAGTTNTLTITVDFSSGTASTLFSRHISEPLAAQTISGNVKAQIRGDVSSVTGCTAFTKTIINVVNPAGAIVAVLLGATNGNSALPGGSIVNRSCPPSTALSSYTCKTGDRVVMELGIVRTSGTTSRTGILSYVSSQGSDLAEDNTSTGGANSWVEFSNTLKFNSGILF